MDLKFGKYKGKTVQEVSNLGDEGLGYLDWLSKNTDPNDPKYGANNKKLLEAIKEAMKGKTFTVKEKKFRKGSGVGGGVSEELLMEIKDINDKCDLLLKSVQALCKAEGIVEIIKEVDLAPSDTPF